MSAQTTVAGAIPAHPLPPLDFPPGSDFAGRFTVIERAGEGGMGVVYKAIDRQLDHVVALKLIHPSVANVPGMVECFKREVRLARQVSHPNVCRVHDLGESGEVLYISMEWIEGETLRRLLNQTRVLKPATALEISAKIAMALDAAHTKDVVHRDLKPENLMIDGHGKVFVMDFGLAIAQGAQPLSAKRGAPGTLPYMSPEQRRGEIVDGRSDLYALGLILWESLTGRSPYPAPDAGEMRSAVPRALVPVLATLLAENRDERYPTAKAFLKALEEAQGRSSALTAFAHGKEPLPRRVVRLWELGVGAAFLIGAGLVYFHYARSPSTRRRPQSGVTQGTIATEEGYSARGLHYLRDEGETVSGLGNAIQMFHRAIEKDPKDALAWAGLGEACFIRYRRTRDSSSKEEADQAVGRAFQLAPDLAEAYQARGLGSFAAGNFLAAKSDFETAVRKKPDLDRAWESLGNASRELENYPGGLKALKEAIRLRPDSFQHYIALGRFFEHFAEYNEAADAYRKAISLKPGSAWGWNNLGAMYLYQARRPEEAVAAFLRSLEIEERGIARSNLGTAYFYQRKYQEAAENYKKATALEPKDADIWGNLGDALQMVGRREPSREAYREAARLAREDLSAHPLDPSAHNQLAKYCAKSGNKDCALTEGIRAAELQPGSAEVDFTNAVVRCILGREAEALDWLERGVKHGLSRVQIEFEPFLIPLHRNPRYRKIIEHAG